MLDHLSPQHSFSGLGDLSLLSWREEEGELNHSTDLVCFLPHAGARTLPFSVMRKGVLSGPQEVRGRPSVPASYVRSLILTSLLFTG